MKSGKSILLFISLLLLFIGCSDKEKSDFSNYIASYTDGVIKSATPIVIQLRTAPDKGYQTGSSLPENILQISPATKGELILKADNTIEFKPTEGWKNGETYKVTLQLDNLCEVPKPFRKFKFEFKVIPLSLRFEPGNLLAEDDNTLTYEAELLSSDDIDTPTVEKKITATYAGTILPISWTHENNRHQFSIPNIQKGEKSQIMQLSFSKDIKEGGETDITIPGLHEFTILNIKASTDRSPVINIYMSEKINPEQNLDGLVTIENTNKLNYKITGNIITLYPNLYDDQETTTITLYPGIKSTTGNTLETEITRTIRLNTNKPQVSFIGKGVIVPADNQVVIPFSAVALKAIDLEIIQILDQNMNFFLQENNYNDANDLRRVGRPIYMKTIDLQKDHPDINLNRWNDFSINLSNLVKLEKGVIYRVKLRFKKSYTTLACANTGEDTEYSQNDWNNPGYFSDYEYPENFNWNEKDDPCTPSYYYGNRFASKNIINTSLGILAKKAVDGKYFISVNDLLTVSPITDCELILYNFQNQAIDTVHTDKNGIAITESGNQAFIIQAKKGNDKAWLKVADASALSLSNFNVSGQNVQMGIKGFIYGERGVWRPGDDIHLSLIVEDKLAMLPAQHPIVAQLIDPKGNIIQTQKENIGTCNIHCFTFKTNENAPTGYWSAVFRIGGVAFTKSIRIETIKPNRLSINMHFPNNRIIGKGVTTAPIKVTTKWLNGAPTPNRKAITEVKLNNGSGTFESYPDYTFTDQSRLFNANMQSLFDGITNGEGNFTFNIDGIKAENAPGILNATFTTRVFENGGDFSIATDIIKYSPYTEYVGIRLPDAVDKWYPTRKPVQLSGVTVNPLGVKSGNGNINIEVYKIEWRWWWESDNNIGNYINQTYNNIVARYSIPLTNGNFSLNLNIRETGRYFIKATDKSGHTTGLIAYFGSWSDADNGETATMLNLNCDKQSYKKGEKIKVTIPSSAGSIAIVSVENGKTVTDIFRMPTTQGSTVIELEATSKMCPNVYIGVSLIQPHNNRDNDRPIRLYGVINVNVEDNALHLEPEIKVAPELRPAQEFTVTVKEKEGKPMNYTIAVVDEGLLSLTTFRTPDPFSVFYAREALGVKTWDFYDYIYGAYGARLDKAFAIGGDEALKVGQDEKTNRFKPVVLFSGPFTLKKGETRQHKFTMPDYIGQVRTTVVAASNGCYGATSVNSEVKQPLMVSLTIPRLFTPGDIIEVPVTVFAMNNQIKEATVTLSTDAKISILGNASQTITFNSIGEKIIWFKIKIKEQTGASNVHIQAISGKEKAIATEDVEIRVPNPRITKVEEKALKAGETISFSATLNGANPLAVIELSSIPSLNLEQRLAYLIDYPHGCVEQITSKAFAQLSLDRLLPLTASEKNRIEEQVKEVINRLSVYQISDGGFTYWPGNPNSSAWNSIYIAHFLITAQKRGYAIPNDMLSKDLKYLQKIANNWIPAEPQTQLEQAYRLYVLALAQSPDLAAMNRLKEAPSTSTTAGWLLASAYALCSHQQIGEKIAKKLSQEVTPYRQTGMYYGSNTRDEAIILEAMVNLGMQQDAYRMLEKISRAMSSDNWYSTQETAFALCAATNYVNKFLGALNGIDVNIRTPEGKIDIKTEKTVYQQTLKMVNNNVSVEIKNNSKSNLYANLTTSAAPYDVVTQTIQSGLQMSIKYYNTSGTLIDIYHLQQGEDVIAEISIKNTGNTGEYEELALSYLLPSGFEIINERLTGNINAFKDAEYTDIRDDRFYLYFDLKQQQTKTFRFRFNAAFAGEYILPAINCSAMYDNSIEAVLPGGKVTISR